MDINQVFIDSINALPSLFKPNQLAYYALTSKPEGEIRDSIAFNIHSNLSGAPLTVSREWKHADLVILDRHKPLIISEFKCAYTFDCMDGNGVGVTYGDLVMRDLSKSMLYALDNTNIYAILFLIHPKARIDRIYEHATKYFRKVNNALSRFQESEISKQAITNMNVYFSRWNLFPQVNQFSCGTEYGVGVDLISFIIGPLSKTAVSEIIASGQK